MAWIVIAAALALAFANGANDNLKGVATLYGSGRLDYRRALALATVATGLGSFASLLLAGTLIRAFSGKGLVPEAELSATLLASVGLGAAATVLLATRLGWPISTTHALVGGLAGAGWIAAGPMLRLGALGASFLLPLLFAPLAAMLLASLAARIGRNARHRLGVAYGDCFCIAAGTAALSESAAASVSGGTRVRIEICIDEPHECRRRYTGQMVGVAVDDAVNRAHLLSASLVSFARGLNDTPKILGLLMGASALEPTLGALLIGLAMAGGGIVAARRVTETLAQGLTPMTPGQGLAGNLATSLLVIGASRLGLPVSTTHASAGAIIGIGVAAGELQRRTLAGVVSAWLVTLPLAGALAAGSMLVLGRLG